MIELDYIKNYVEGKMALENIESKQRSDERVEARMVFCVIAKTYTDHTHQQIGEIINRDHSSVTYMLQRANTLYTRPKTKMIIDSWKQAFKYVYNSKVIEDNKYELLEKLQEQQAEIDSLKMQLIKAIIDSEKVIVEVAPKSVPVGIESLISELDDQQLEELKARIEPIVKMMSVKKYALKREVIEKGIL